MALATVGTQETARRTAYDGFGETRIGEPVPPPREAEESNRRTPPPNKAPDKLALTRLLGRTLLHGADSVLLEPGKQLAGTPYRIVRWLGDGGMGIVYEAQHVSLERRVALKVLRPEASEHPATARLFRDEARTVSKIGSDHIVEVFDLDELPDGRLWFAMELLPGRTLGEELSIGPIEATRAIPILRQVCKGLAAAHAAGVIHRDIKPGNIALTSRGGRADAVKLLDFGVSALASEVERGHATRAGTPYYMAPEVVAELRYDARVDLYSLGCTAFEMVCGRPPFVADTVEALLVARLDSAAPNVSDFAKVDVPPALAEVIRKCLARHAEDRYESALDLEAALCEAQVAAGLRTTWDDLELPHVDPQRRDRLLRRMPDPARAETGFRSKLLVALGAAALAGGGVLWWSASDAADLQDEAEVQRLTNEAHEAAAKSFFVYPPAAAPDTPTAYIKVLELERLAAGSEEEADERAGELRSEFSETLVRLGDHYWDRLGGRPFAIDYYAAALMFDGGLEHARERVTMTPGELTTLKQKAEHQDFTPAELEASEALVALAESDPQERLRRLEELQAAPTRSAVAAARLSELIDVEAVHTVRKPRVRVPEKAPAQVELDAAAASDPEVLVESEQEQEAQPTAKPRDRDAARALSQRGEAALRRGDVNGARRLFEQAISADSRFAGAHDGLSRVHFHRGAYAEAARVGAKAVRFAPRRGEYRIHLGDAYYKAFRYAEANKQYEKAAELGHSAAASRLSKTRAKLKR